MNTQKDPEKNILFYEAVRHNPVKSSNFRTEIWASHIKIYSIVENTGNGYQIKDSVYDSNS